MSDNRKEHYEPWIGVDLDGTLAHQPEDKKFVPDRIGEPVQAMFDRVREWCDDGKTVKIFTARADDEKSVTAIKKWLKKHGLPDLEITNLKDPGMTELWDDKAVGVEKNTGKIAETIVDKLLEAGTWTEFWLSPQSEIIRAIPGHIDWAVKNVLRPDEWRKDSDGSIVGVYQSMRKRGWVRLIIQQGRIFVDPTHCSRDQMAELEFTALDTRRLVVDDKTGKTIFNPAHDDAPEY